MEVRHRLLPSGRLAPGTLTFMEMAPTSGTAGPPGTQSSKEQLSPCCKLGGPRLQGPPCQRSTPTFPWPPAMSATQ